MAYSQTSQNIHFYPLLVMNFKVLLKMCSSCFMALKRKAYGMFCKKYLVIFFLNFLKFQCLWVVKQNKRVLSVLGGYFDITWTVVLLPLPICMTPNESNYESYQYYLIL